MSATGDDSEGAATGSPAGRRAVNQNPIVKITATATCPLFDSNAKQEHEIEVSLTDRRGDEVAHAVLRTLVGPKKR